MSADEAQARTRAEGLARGRTDAEVWALVERYRAETEQRYRELGPLTRWPEMYQRPGRVADALEDIYHERQA